DNPLNKYTVSPRNDLKYNDDGSLDIYIQHESPGKDKEANWLPAPKDKFALMMRLYWPKEKDPSIIDGTWKPPAVEGMATQQMADLIASSRRGRTPAFRALLLLMRPRRQSHGDAELEHFAMIPPYPQRYLAAGSGAAESHKLG